MFKIRIRLLDTRQVKVPEIHKDVVGMDYIKMSEVTSVALGAYDRATLSPSIYKIRFADGSGCQLLADQFSQEERAILDSLRPNKILKT